MRWRWGRSRWRASWRRRTSEWQLNVSPAPMRRFYWIGRTRRPTPPPLISRRRRWRSKGRAHRRRWPPFELVRKIDSNHFTHPTRSNSRVYANTWVVLNSINVIEIIARPAANPICVDIVHFGTATRSCNNKKLGARDTGNAALPNHAAR